MTEMTRAVVKSSSLPQNWTLLFVHNGSVQVNRCASGQAARGGSRGVAKVKPVQTSKRGPGKRQEPWLARVKSEGGKCTRQGERGVQCDKPPKSHPLPRLPIFEGLRDSEGPSQTRSKHLPTPLEAWARPSLELTSELCPLRIEHPVVTAKRIHSLSTSAQGPARREARSSTRFTFASHPSSKVMTGDSLTQQPPKRKHHNSKV